MKETKDIHDYKNYKQVRRSSGEAFKNKDILRDENIKQVRKSMGYPLNKKEMLRYEKVKQVHTYFYIVSTGKLNNERARGKYFN